MFLPVSQCVQLCCVDDILLVWHCGCIYSLVNRMMGDVIYRHLYVLDR